MYYSSLNKEPHHVGFKTVNLSQNKFSHINYISHIRPKKVNNMFLRHFLTLSVRTSQATNKMAANDGRPKLTISDV